VLAHIGDAGPAMWIHAEGALWRAFHFALLDKTRAVVRSVILDGPVIEHAVELGVVVERYRRAVARRFPTSSRGDGMPPTLPAPAAMRRRA
jgi:hypothetical protein